MSGRSDIFDGLRRDWYGPDRAPLEISAAHVQLRPVGDLIDKALFRIVPQEILRMEHLRTQWADFAGEENARHSEPAFVKEKVLYVEVRHPAYRIGLDTPPVKEGILARIRTVFGERFCTEIRFVPSGRRRVFPPAGKGRS